MNRGTNLSPAPDTEPDLEHAIATGWQRWESTPPGVDRDRLRDELWQLEDRADGLDDLRRDVLLDRLAAAAPECLCDLLEFADRVIEVA